MKMKMYVCAAEVGDDWGISRAKAYQIIRMLNEKMQDMNPNLIVIPGKANRKFYEEHCYGICRETILDEQKNQA